MFIGCAMKTLTLHRNYFQHGTFSILCDENGNPILKTVEREWANNTPNISCIPEGVYDVTPHDSPRFGKCLALSAPSLGVTIYGPSLRTHCLIHAANKPSQLQGCIAPGLDFGVVDNEWAVLSSRDALLELMKYIDHKPAKLIIRKA